ncbi:hypothetical protein J1N35_015033, partial [Gossypium stocksii]
FGRCTIPTSPLPGSIDPFATVPASRLPRPLATHRRNFLPRPTVSAPTPSLLPCCASITAVPSHRTRFIQPSKPC